MKHSSGRVAEEVDQHEVILRFALGVGEDAIEDVKNLADLDLQSRLLQNLPGDAFAKLFTKFEHAAGDRPFAFERLGGATDNEDTITLDDDGADTDDGTIGIISLQMRDTGRRTSDVRKSDLDTSTMVIDVRHLKSSVTGRNSSD
jgi:hypothetical protein